MLPLQLKQHTQRRDVVRTVARVVQVQVEVVARLPRRPLEEEWMRTYLAI